MALYMLCTLFAYYILKPVSRALFLNKFDIDQLPYLYILIAFVGGMLAYLYTRVAVGSSLLSAVNRATAIAIGSLLVIWWLLRFDFDWMLYVFNIWVSLFSVITVSQGWLVAANVFDSREAKRLYGLLGLSGVAGAAFGGELTARLARLVDARDLLLVTAGMVLLAYGFIRAVAMQKNVNIADVRTKGEEEEFSFRDILDGIRRHRHLQVIMAIITITFIVDVMVDYQFSVMAKTTHGNKEDLTAFLGTFYGLYLNMATFVMQMFLTAVIVRYLGVGGTLQIMPVVIGISSAVMIFVPKVGAAAVLRLSEAATRYSFNRTGMELLYLPLPADLKNRTKAFVDIFMDRFGRGLGGLVLVAYLALVEKDAKHPHMSRVAGMILVISILWILLSVRVSREYLATIRRRLESRRLDFSDARVTVGDHGTVALLEKTLATGTPRQSAYALRLLADTPGYDIGPTVEAMARHTAAECRTGAFRAAADAMYKGLTEIAAGELESGRPAPVQQAAAAYLAKVSPDAPLDAAWVRGASTDPDPARRALAAYVTGLRATGKEANGDSGTLRQLLDDPDPLVASAACRSAGRTGDRLCFEQIVQRLADQPVRGTAIESLALYGARVCGSLGDVLTDASAPVAVRRQIPRVLRLIHDQRSVEALMTSINCEDSRVRAAVLRALNRLREAAPQLQFPAPLIGQRIQERAAMCLRLHALTIPLRAAARPRTASALLVRTLETRIHEGREAVFRLLGLRYSPGEIYNTWLALQSGNADRVIAASDYLDSILDRDLKRAVMPLLETPDRIQSHARESFPKEASSPDAAIITLFRLYPGESWMTSCAIAAASEMNLKGLAADISRAGGDAGPEAAKVARLAEAALA
jgi:AAA family ATP:ADP antiporter